MYYFLKKYPEILKFLYPRRISRLHSPRTIYLTFDDGPIPKITPWVLDLLKQYNAKATFFCIGDNVDKHPDIFLRILDEGHSIGNHTHNHVDGWIKSTKAYIKNVLLAEQAILKHQTENTPDPDLKRNFEFAKKMLFRPPYGKITNTQAKAVVKLNYDIVMWDVLSGDFDNSLSAEKCLKNVLKYTVEGSTIVFHDSIKAFKNLEIILPQVLKHYSDKAYEFKGL